MKKQYLAPEYRMENYAQVEQISVMSTSNPNGENEVNPDFT